MEKYLAEMKSKINEFDSKIEKLHTITKQKSSPEVARDATAHISEFQVKKEALVKKLDQLKNTPDEEVGASKSEIETIYEELVAYFDTILGKYSSSSETGLY